MAGVLESTGTSFDARSHQWRHDGIYAYDKFYIRWYGKDGTTLTKDLRVATHGDHFIVQHRVKDYKGRMKCCMVLGYYVHKFMKGDNLYDWLMKIKNATENKERGKEINTMILFGLSFAIVSMQSTSAFGKRLLLFAFLLSSKMSLSPFVSNLNVF